MKAKKINIPIFRGTLTLIKDKNFKKVNKKYNLNISENYGAVSFQKNENGFEYFVCFIDTNKSLLMHEAIHICNYVFKNIGVRLDLENDEVQAYFTGWIVDEMIKFLKEIK